MGRPRASDATAPRRQRTRTGCSTCRLKKVKCDEARPVCTRCKQRGLPCRVGVQLKWEDDYASRGMSFGRQGIWGKPGLASPAEHIPTALNLHDTTWCPLPQVEPHLFVHTSIDDISDLILRPKMPTQLPPLALPMQHALGNNADDIIAWPLVNTIVQPTEAVDLSLYPKALPRSSNEVAALSVNTRGTVTDFHFFAGRPSLQPSLSCFPDTRSTETFELLSYYIKKFCPLTTAASTSPFASVLVPYAVAASQNVLISILAVAACLRSQFEPVWKRAALRLKHQVLQALRQRLSLDYANAISNTESLIVMLMLCMFEIVSECDAGWVVHLQGARDLIGLRRQHRHLPAFNEVDLFAERFFAFQDVISRTACGEAPKFGSDYWDSDAKEVDSWMGCSPQLARILSTITDLSRLRQNNHSVSSEDWFILRTTWLEEELDSLEQVIPGVEEEMLHKAAELKRLSAIVYLHCALNHASPSTLLVKEHVSRILELLASFVDRREMAGMTWPIFVAAVELDPLDDSVCIQHSGRQTVNGRRYILEALNSLLKTSVANAPRTQEAVVKAWNARDLASADDNDYRNVSHYEWRNDWERFVAPFSGNLSLA